MSTEQKQITGITTAGQTPDRPGWWWGRVVMTCGDKEPLKYALEPRRVMRGEDGELYAASPNGSLTTPTGRHGTGGVWWWEWAGFVPPPAMRDRLLESANVQLNTFEVAAKNAD